MNASLCVWLIVLAYLGGCVHSMYEIGSGNLKFETENVECKLKETP